MGTLVEKPDAAWKVPPLKLKAAVPAPWVKAGKTQQSAVEIVGSRGTGDLAKDQAAGTVLVPPDCVKLPVPELPMTQARKAGRCHSGYTFRCRRRRIRGTECRTPYWFRPTA